MAKSEELKKIMKGLKRAMCEHFLLEFIGLFVFWGIIVFKHKSIKWTDGKVKLVWILGLWQIILITCNCYFRLTLENVATNIERDRIQINI
jgi:hypothetical protein